MLEVFQKSKITYTPFNDKISYKIKMIMNLAKYLNLTIHQVSRHSEMLYEMDTKMFIMNKTLQDIMWSIDFL